MVEIYIGNVACFEDGAFYENLLSCVREVRREQIGRMRRKEDRWRALGAELLLMHALYEHGIRDFSVSRGTYGKPYLSNTCGLFFNLSHSGDYAMCALSDCEIGCDVERIDPRIDLAIAERFFDPSESEWIFLGESREEQADRFFRLWTLKESLMKATGEGFSRSPRSFSFLMEGETPILKNPARELLPYSFSELSAPRGYHAAICGACAEFDSFSEISFKNVETLYRQ